MIFSSQEKVTTFLETIDDNSNPIFLDKNLLIIGNKNFEVKKEFYNEARMFLQKINLENIYELKGVLGNRKLTKMIVI